MKFDISPCTDYLVCAERDLVGGAVDLGSENTVCGCLNVYLRVFQNSQIPPTQA